MEYIMTYLVMTGICIAVSYMGKSSIPAEDRRLTSLFLVSGTVTCFLDFLTTETLTFTVPFLLCLFLRRNQECLGTFRQELYSMIRYGIAWLASYASMFAVKWGLIFFVLGKADFENALQSAATRMDGSIVTEGVSMAASGASGQQLSGAMLRNLACLFPVTSDISTSGVLVLTFGALAIWGTVFYLFRKDPVDTKLIGLLLLTALIPYVRFLCLSNHSYIHYFFSYRAQMASVMALLGILVFSIWPSRHTGTKKAAVNRRDALYRLLQYSLFEESLTDLNEINDDALFDYPWFDAYFSEPEREAYFICDRVSDKLLGFAMINTYLMRAETGHSIAEFMVLPKYRRQGIGTRAAKACFSLYPGYWEVRPSLGSRQAYGFWQKVIQSCTSGRYAWRDQVFSFDIQNELRNEVR